MNEFETRDFLHYEWQSNKSNINPVSDNQLKYQKNWLILYMIIWFMFNGDYSQLNFLTVKFCLKYSANSINYHNQHYRLNDRTYEW